MNIRIGTRKSQLALWQAEHVAKRLSDQGYSTELVPIETKGDKVLDVTIAKIGSKGVFTEELESLLSSGEVDIAILAFFDPVHYRFSGGHLVKLYRHITQVTRGGA